MANTVDHVKPHRGDQKLFWDPENHQSLCATCHNSDKQRMEKSGRGFYHGCDVNGEPLDRSHHWRTAQTGSGK